MNALACLRLLQLASQALPIGGYSHSQGLESAIDNGLVGDEHSARQWIGDVLAFSLGCYELPVLKALSAAWQDRDGAAVRRLNDDFLASRESAELRAATVQMGYSLHALLKVLPDLDPELGATLHTVLEPTLPCVWSGLAHGLAIPGTEAALAYAWTWAENQVLVAIKIVPLGQSAGQRILLALGSEIAALVDAWAAPGAAAESASPRRSNFAPGLAILSAQHETQYSRLFRS